MKTRTPILFLLLVLFCSVYFPAQAQQENTYSQFYEGFQSPPAQAYPIVYHWWLGGHVDTLRLKEELLAFKNAGIAGFTIFEIGSRDTVLVGTGPAFLGDESLETIRFAIEEAGKLGLEVGLNTASSWNAGGNWLPPQHAAKSIYQSKVSLQGGGKTAIKVPFPEIPEVDPRGRRRLIEYGGDGKPVYSEEIAVLAIPEGNSPADTSKIQVVSGFFNPQTEILEWNAPDGDWKIIRYVSSNSGENLILPSKYSAGPIVDHFDADATAFHFNYIIDRLQSVLGDLRDTALKSLYMASYEAKGFTWTPTLPGEFRAINGYDLVKFLPALFDEVEYSTKATANFTADFQRTLSELMIKNFYMKSKEISNAHGLKNNSEAGGPGLPVHNVPVEPLKALGKGLDIPRGEFWINHGRYNEEGIDILRVVKEVSSASNIYGSGIVEMEAFTSFQHWQEGPFEMKPIGDRAFAEGMNKVVVHGSTHNPAGTGYPGIVYHAGTHYNDKRVWWPKVKPFNDFLARVSYVLQEADFTADVLFYYGDTIPNYGGHKHGRFSAGAGYDYEIINTEILLELEVRNGDIVIPKTGTSFKLLALTEEFEINPEVLIKLNDMLNEGATIIGPKPKKIAQRKIRPGMPDMEGWLDKLWRPFNTQNFKSAPASVFYGAEPAEVLKAKGISPDILYEDMGFFTLDYIHYQKEGLDFYFMVNTAGDWVSREVGFRQQDKTPEVWDPVTGKRAEVFVYRNGEGHVTLPLTLAPYESKFVVFKPGTSSGHYTQVIGPGLHPPLTRFTENGLEFWEEGEFELDGANKPYSVSNTKNVKTLDGAWEIFFPEGWGAPERAVFPELKSWTESPVEGIRYFSGTARYEKQFVHGAYHQDLSGARVYLDLGDLSHVGEVWLNDQSLGITWAKPHRFDITDHLVRGVNTLKVEVANTWANRIIGDAITGESYTQTHITETMVKGTEKRVPWAQIPLIPSGLFGPVSLVTVQPVSPPAQLAAAAIFSDHMVLQRDKPIQVWEKGHPGEKVKVQLGKAVEETIIGRNGQWQVHLPAFQAGGPYALHVQGLKKIEFKDVLIGDVWLASGQSNMQHPIAGWEWIPHSEIFHAEEELEDSNYPEIGLFSVPLYPSRELLEDLPKGKWEKVDKESLAQFSASAWFFAKALNQELEIPIGIIHSSWGGTSILAWTNEQALDDFRDSLTLKAGPEEMYDPLTWTARVKESAESNRLRRNQISYPDPQIKETVLSSGYGNNNWSVVDLTESGEYGYVAWLIRKVKVSADFPKKDLELSLGFLNRQSHLYWNGKELGYFQYPAPVQTVIPAEWIRNGENVLVVRLANPWGSAAAVGQDELFYLKQREGDFSVSLDKEWRIAENLEPISTAKPSMVNKPGYLFNGMIAPLIPYEIKGFIWDQGSADASRPDLYAQLFQRLIKDWRKLWKDDQLPFLFVQNTNTYTSHEFGKRSFVRSHLREAQEKALQLPGTGMVVSIDLGDPYDVHPQNKQEFGWRLALQALQKVYKKDIIADGPFYDSHYFKGDTMVVKVTGSSGLMMKGGDSFCGFELVDKEGAFYPVDSWLEKGEIFLFSPEINDSNELRYAWGENPRACVFNKEGLPLAPFRVEIKKSTI